MIEGDAQRPPDYAGIGTPSGCEDKMRDIVFLFLILLLLAATNLSAQSEPEWQWAAQAGGTGSEAGSAIATGINGNSYAAGCFYGTSCFGTTQLNSSGNSDIFVAKLDQNGNWVWAIQAGGASFDEAKCITVDSSENIYISGYFSETASFGSTSLGSDGGREVFVAKADSDGNWLWAVSAGGTGNERGLGIAVDSTGGIYLTGFFEDTAYFGPLLLTSSGGNDIFVAKLDGEGDWLWAFNAGGSGSDVGRAVSVFGDACLYVTGSFTETVLFGNTTLTSSGGKDVFIGNLDTNGNWIWAKKAGGASDESAHGIAGDNAANVYLTGRFIGVIHFGDISLSSSGFEDCFIAKLDSDGNWQWAVRAGGPGQDFGEFVAVDNAANVYFTGYFEDTASFGSAWFASIGYVDIFVAKLDSDGNWQWAVQAGGTNYDFGKGIAVDGSAHIHLTGSFLGTAGFGTISLGTNGASDIFVAKLSPGGVWLNDAITPQIPGLSRLDGVYPNPLRKGDSAFVKTHVSDLEGGTLKLFDIRGQLLLSRSLQPGTQQTSLDTRRLSPGVYLYQLTTPTAQMVKKLILVN
ncbi:MAG: T9SS type A sorting domain-containing protein [Candidatus Cloacimonetes bacterium]|nr:T9SS type A sorting domain-containing protein [Candidatus Cloacimonadota bacterium]